MASATVTAVRVMGGLAGMDIIIALALTTALPGWTATLNVPGAYGTIQAAIVAAGAGDVVVVQPGTYRENLSLMGKSITVQGIAPTDTTVVASTIVDGGGSGSVVTFANDEGRPAIPLEARELIRRMSRVNPNWGAPRILEKLEKLGIVVAGATVRKYMLRRRKPPSPTGRAFLSNHAQDLAAVDFFVVPTVRFKVLFVLVVLAHQRRRVMYFGVTENPTAQWTAQQIVEAFRWGDVPRHLLRDRDGVYGKHFRDRVRGMGIEEVMTAPPEPLARCLRRATDRQYPAGVSRLRHRAERGPSEASVTGLSQLLPPLAHPSLAGYGLSGVA